MSGLLGHRGLLLATSGEVNQGWSPADKNTGVTLSNGNLTAERTSEAFPAVRAVRGRSAGKFYFEVATSGAYDSAASASLYVVIGSGSCDLSAQFIFGTPGAAYAAWRGNAQYGTQDGSLGTHAGLGWAASSGVRWAGIAVDLDTREATLYENGTQRNTVTYGTGGGTMYPLLSYGDGHSGAASRVTLRLRTSEFSGSIPSGFEAWGAP